MILKQSFRYKKKYEDNVEVSLAMMSLIEELKYRGFVVDTHDNRIEFNYRTQFTTNSSDNEYGAFRLLRHGTISVNESQGLIQILCKYDVTNLVVMSSCFGLAMLGLFLLYSDNKIFISILVLIITFGLVLGIGMISLRITVRNLIKK